MEVDRHETSRSSFSLAVVSVGKSLMFGSIFCLLLTVGFYEAQTDKSKPVSNRLLYRAMQEDKPSIYLSYVGVGSIDENCSLKKQNTYQLKLHNNSSYPININANYNVKSPALDLRLSDGTRTFRLLDGSKVSDVCYQAEPILKMESFYANGKLVTEEPVERSTPEIPITCRCVWSQQRTRRDDSYHGVWIPSGSSIIFDVPQQYFENDIKIYTLFNFEWEFENGLLRYNEPNHRVYFDSSDIPRK